VIVTKVVSQGVLAIRAVPGGVVVCPVGQCPKNVRTLGNLSARCPGPLYEPVCPMPMASNAPKHAVLKRFVMEKIQ